MKKLFSYPLLVIASFFLLSLKVGAINSDYYLYDDTDFTYIDKWEVCKPTLETYLTTNGYDLHYYVYFYGMQYYDDIFHVFVSGQQPWNYLVYENNNALSIENSSSWSSLTVNIATCSVSSASYNTRYTNAPIYYNSTNYTSNFPQYIIYSTDNIGIWYNVCSLTTDTITYKYENNSYTASCETDKRLFTLTELNNIWNAPPDPPNNSLSSFYSTVITSISTFSGGVVENDYLLAIFVIYIFIFITLFLRRFLNGQ